MKNALVRTRSKEERVELLDFLENEGFYYAKCHNRQETEESPFPIGVCLEEKWINHILNVTCAAASVGMHITPEEFYYRYEEVKATYHSPVIVHVPHASTEIPEEDKAYFITDDLKGEVLRMTDHYCDDLFDCDHDMIAFEYSRLVCDVERFKDDKREPMARLGMGFAYTHGSDLQKIRELPEDYRVYVIEEGFYDRHHDKLGYMVKRRLLEHGKCLIVDAHSFPAEALPYEKYCGCGALESDSGGDRPDICIGTDDYHTGADLLGKTRRFFDDRGYKVAVNDPFAGTIVPEAYYRKDPRVQSIMIEVNRKLYMYEDARKTEGYERTKGAIREYMDVVEEWL